MPTLVIKTVKASGGDYSTVDAWEAASQVGSLVTADEVRRAECYGFADTTFTTTVAGATVDSTRHREIVAAAGAEAQLPWNTSTAFRLSSYGVPVLLVQEDYVQVRRIQIETTGDDNGLCCIQIDPANVGVTVRGCFLRSKPQAYTFGSNSQAIRCGVDAAGDRYLINNVIEWDFAAGSTDVIGILTENHAAGKTYAYNNTIVGRSTATGALGTKDNFGDIIYKNNLIKGFLGGAFNSVTSGNCTNNAADDTTAIGTGARTSQTFTFAGAGDYHLASGDAGAKDHGVDLSADGNFPFSDDVDGVARSGTWDIGADEFVGGGAAVFNPYFYRFVGGL